MRRIWQRSIEYWNANPINSFRWTHLYSSVVLEMNIRVVEVLQRPTLKKSLIVGSSYHYDAHQTLMTVSERMWKIKTLFNMYFCRFIITWCPFNAKYKKCISWHIPENKAATDNRRYFYCPISISSSKLIQLHSVSYIWAVLIILLWKWNQAVSV